MTTPSDPRITVIIATYNSSATLRCALLSLLAQDCTDFEAWVVGDCCTDDSGEVVTSLGDARLKWTNLPTNSGSQGAPNNEGLRRARGRYIAYLGHDDLWWPWHLSGLARCLETTSADLVHPLIAIYLPGSAHQMIGPPGQGRTYADHFVPPSGWLHRREVVEEVGGWGDHRRLARGVDFDLQRRLTSAGKRIAFYEHLSVLKFPSAPWRTYARSVHLPQEAWLRAMQEDPISTEHRVLLELAVSFARWSNEKPTLRAALSRTVRLAVRRVVECCGEELWPLRPLLHWRYRQVRRRLRRQRGLPS